MDGAHRFFRRDSAEQDAASAPAQAAEARSDGQIEMDVVHALDASPVLSGIKAGLPKQNIHVVPAGAGVAVMKEDYGASLHILLGVCCLVLLIACANIANLLLARGASRRAQTSVRLALGASRRRLVRQALTESVVLAVLGGIAGIGVAYLGVKAIVAVAFSDAKFVPIDAAPSLTVLAFAFGLSLLTGVIFGTAPAWLTSHANPVEALRGANRSTRDSSSLSQKILRDRTGHAVDCSHRRRRTTDAELAESAASGTRLRDQSSRGDQPDRSVLVILTAQT